MYDHEGEKKRPKAGLLASFQAVAWGFLGIRRRRGYESDAQRLNPVHVIIAGIIAAALFVLLLLRLVKYVVSTS